MVGNANRYSDHVVSFLSRQSRLLKFSGNGWRRETRADSDIAALDPEAQTEVMAEVAPPKRTSYDYYQQHGLLMAPTTTLTPTWPFHLALVA